MATTTAAQRREQAKRDYDAFLDGCPTRELLSRLTDKWVALVIPALADGPQRHGELAHRIAGVSQKMLTQTLRTLERDGLVTRTVTASVPVRVDYALTPLGHELFPVMIAIKNWAETHMDRVFEARTQYDARPCELRRQSVPIGCCPARSTRGFASRGIAVAIERAQSHSFVARMTLDLDRHGVRGLRASTASALAAGDRWWRRWNAGRTAWPTWRPETPTLFWSRTSTPGNRCVGESLVRVTLDRFGQLDVLVNNAGRGLVGAVEEVGDAQVRELMDRHLFGPAALVRAALPAMRSRGAGMMVQMSSQGGRMAFPGVSKTDSASKLALEGWSASLAWWSHLRDP